MPLNFGMVIVTKAGKEYECLNKECVDTVIPKDRLFARFIVKSRKGTYFTQSFHIYCVSDFLHIRGNAWLDSMVEQVNRNMYTREVNPVVGTLVNLPPEIKKRRLTLLKYLNNADIGLLCNAYRKGKQSRVYTVMLHMAQRMSELELIDEEWNVKSPWWVLHLHDFPELKRLVMAHDARWWGEVSKLLFYPDKVDRGEVIAMFLRGENSPTPYWQPVSEYDIVRVEEPDDGKVQVSRVPHD